MAEKQVNRLSVVAWEVTRSCNLSCAHCRASSGPGPYQGELSSAECFKLIDEISSFAKPLIILTGGEPLLRKDIFEIAGYAKSKGLPMVMALNGTLLDAENVAKILKTGIKRISVSLDGPDAASHEELRQVNGAFNAALSGIIEAKKGRLQFQINSTITQNNVGRITQILDLAVSLGAASHHIFLLVPTGRARDMRGDELSAQGCEETFKLLAEKIKKSPIPVKVTCAPHFNRILLQQQRQSPENLSGRGCMAGVSFCFISHLGKLAPCGYLDIQCADLRKESFKRAWSDSEVFNNLRDFSKYQGKCGVCEFRDACGGCRARAHAQSGDYLREEPYCLYEPEPKINCAG